LKGLRFPHVSAIALAAAFILLAADKAGHLRGKQPTWTPPPKAQPRVVEAAKPDAGKPPPHNDKVEDLPEGKGREVTFYTCTACHGVALIKAQGLTRELWEHSFDLMLERHRMPPVKPGERAEILDYLAEQFPPRRRARSGDNPFLK
jgi:hypothetical protein